jgi:hypothetical protein
MAMRSQLYEWTATATIVDIQSSIFIGGTGNNITKPAETTATQFVVIEQVASTGSNPNTYTNNDAAGGVHMFAQVRINTTDYFLDPDNKPNDGIPGTASPYPRTLTLQPSFSLYPDIYVLPGQVYDVLVVQRGQNIAGGGSPVPQQCFVKYTLYDGPDALIANKLLELGISVSPANVDWYKRSLIQQQSAVVA